MEMIAQFTVVRGATESLITRVNELIVEGWQPCSGFQNAGHEGDSFTFYGQQAMVKFGDTTPSVVAAEATAEEVLPAEAEVLEQFRAA